MRALTNDHNLFKEAINAFNKTKSINLFKEFETSKSKRVYGYLILDFDLSKDMVFDDFTIHKSIKTDLNINRSGLQVKVAFVSPVTMPERINFISSHLYTLALSSICSFAFERAVHSTKNADFNNFEIADSFGLKSIGIEFPTTIAGSNSTKFNIHIDIIMLWENRLKAIITLIDKLLLEQKDIKFGYESVMQSFRLIQLAHINKKEDFDLAYSFLIAGIESVSQIAIPRKTDSNKHLLHNDWKALAKKDDTIKSLFNEYLLLKERDNNEDAHRDLTKRFVDFLVKYNTNTDWEEVLYDEMITYGIKVREIYSNEISINQELAPNTITQQQFAVFIKDTYHYRSKFFHTGLALPHTKPNNSFSERFFQIILNREKVNALEEKKKKEKRIESTHEEWFKTKDILIRYELMSTMARVSITNYLKEIVEL